MAEEKKPPSERTLAGDIPELKEYLRSGAKVLDVGCGEGTITLGVAAMVDPGDVVGIDPSEEQIGVARAWAAQVSHAGNITFQVGDSHRLDFPDETFDVVYSHTALHFFLDPVQALQEQKRVTKKGGWVIASGVNDLITTRYPPCPHWERVWQALADYWQSMLRAFQTSSDDPQTYLKRLNQANPTAMIYYDLSAGRKCPEWFAKAGLDDLQIKVKADVLQFSGGDFMEPGFWDLLLLAEPELKIDHQLALSLEQAMDTGLLTEETLNQAQEEVRAWYKDPHAFNFWTFVFAAGRA